MLGWMRLGAEESRAEEEAVDEHLSFAGRGSGLP